MQKPLKILAISVIALVFYGMTTSFMNQKAYDIKTTVTQGLLLGLKSQSPVVLREIGNIKWDYICAGSYEARGIDVASGVWIAERALVNHEDDSKFSFSDFDVADETYTEFSGSREGLIFISVQEKVLISTLFPSDVRWAETSCVGAIDAVLDPVPYVEYPNTGNPDNGYFRLSGTKLR